MLMKTLRGYLLIGALLIAAWFFGGENDGWTFTLAVTGGFAAGFVSSRKRVVTCEGFRLVDHYGNLRAQLGLTVPDALQRGSAIEGAKAGWSGKELDTPPGLDLYRKDGRKAATLNLDPGPEGGAALVLFGEDGESQAGIFSNQLGKGLRLAYAESGKPSVALLLTPNEEPYLEIVDRVGNSARYTSSRN